MKKILFIIFLSSFMTQAFSQTDYVVSLCGKTKKILTMAEFNSCKTLEVNRKDCKVVSFMLSFSSGNIVSEINREGNNFNSYMIEAIKKHNPNKIFLEKIIITLEDGTRRTMPPLTYTIK